MSAVVSRVLLVMAKACLWRFLDSVIVSCSILGIRITWREPSGTTLKSLRVLLRYLIIIAFIECCYVPHSAPRTPFRLAPRVRRATLQSSSDVLPTSPSKESWPRIASPLSSGNRSLEAKRHRGPHFPQFPYTVAL